MPGFGLYVHVPFCSALCPYCDFAVVVGRADQHAAYFAALDREAAREAWPVERATVFVGGGTPTFVDPDLLAASLSRALDELGRPPIEEFTVEANPDSVRQMNLTRLVEAGMDRISIGAQSFDDEVLRALGRTHEATHIETAVQHARAAGITNVSLDLIYGSPGETDASWERSMREALALEPQHLSCYALTIEERTAFGKAVATNTMRAPEDDVLVRRFEVACDLLEENGFLHYEISNWAKPGRQSQHNLVYWTQGDYLGLGLGAHSHRDGTRWSNARALSSYLADPTHHDQLKLTERERADEWLSLRMRLLDPIEIDEAQDKLGHQLETGMLEEAGLIVRENGRIALTRRGMMLENDVTARLLANGTDGRARNHGGTSSV